MRPKDRSSLLFNETPGLARRPSRDVPAASRLVAIACHQVYSSGARWKAPETHRSRNSEVGRGNRTDRESAFARSGQRSRATSRGRVKNASSESRPGRKRADTDARSPHGGSPKSKRRQAEKIRRAQCRAPTKAAGSGSDRCRTAARSNRFGRMVHEATRRPRVGTRNVDARQHTRCHESERSRDSHRAHSAAAHPCAPGIKQE
jgi:hypothetical protein